MRRLSDRSNILSLAVLIATTVSVILVIREARGVYTEGGLTLSTIDARELPPLAAELFVTGLMQGNDYLLRIASHEGFYSEVSEQIAARSQKQVGDGVSSSDMFITPIELRRDSLEAVFNLVATAVGTDSLQAIDSLVVQFTPEGWKVVCCSTTVGRLITLSPGDSIR